VTLVANGARRHIATMFRTRGMRAMPQKQPEPPSAKGGESLGEPDRHRRRPCCPVGEEGSYYAVPADLRMQMRCRST